MIQFPSKQDNININKTQSEIIESNSQILQINDNVSSMLSKSNKSQKQISKDKENSSSLTQRSNNDNNKHFSPRQHQIIYSKKNTIQRQKTSKTFNNGTETRSQDINTISGFSYLQDSHTKYYFRKIKLGNKGRYEEAYYKEKTEALFKFIFYILSNIINIFNVIIYIAYTYFDNNNSKSTLIQFLSISDLLCAFYFGIELLIRIVYNKDIKYLISWDGIIDLLSVFPSIIVFFINESIMSTILRTVKVFRVLRIYKSLRALQYDNNTFSDGNDVLSIQNIKWQLLIIVDVFFSLFFIATGIIYGIEQIFPDAFNGENMNFVDCLYFVIVTTTTLGYGDIYPTNPIARMLVILLIISFISLVSYQFSKLVQLFNLLGNYSKYTIKSHVIVLIDNTIDLYGVLREIKKYNHRQSVVVISGEIESLPSTEFPYNKVYLIVSKTIDIDILERANAKHAAYFIIFAKINFKNFEQTEKVNEFIVLKINEYCGHVPIYMQSIYNDKSFLNIEKKSPFKHVHRKHSNYNNNQQMNIKKIVPIFRIKSLIMAKATFIPGYANFMQNLILNNREIPSNIDRYDMIMQAYFMGCENELQIKELPRFFINQNFDEAMRQIYSKSMRDYIIKVSARDLKNMNRPVLLIGVIDVNNTGNWKENKRILIFPKVYKITPKTLGIFISYKEENYLSEVLNSFPNNIEYTLLEEEMQDSQDSKYMNDKQLKRRQGFSEEPYFMDEEDRNRKIFKKRVSFTQMRSNKKLLSLINKDSFDNPNISQLNINNRQNALVNSNKNSFRFHEKHYDNIISELNDLVTHKPRKHSFEEEINELPSNNNHLNIKTKDNYLNVNSFQNQNKNLLQASPSDFKQVNIVYTNKGNNQTLDEEENNQSEEYDNINAINFDNNNNHVIIKKHSGNKINNLKSSKTLSHNILNRNGLYKKISNQCLPDLSSNLQQQKVIKHEETKPITNNEENENIFRKYNINNNNSFLLKGNMIGNVTSDNDVCLVLTENQALKQQKIIDRENFISKKNQIITGRNEFKDIATKRNLIFLESLETEDLDYFYTTIVNQTNRRYRPENAIESDYLIENRIFDCAKTNISEILNNHIVFVGYQDGINKLLKLIQLHYPYKDICIMTDYAFEDSAIVKYLRMFKHLYHLKGNLSNPLHLINAGISKASHVLFLVDTIDKRTNEDMAKILGFRAVDYFFQTDIILELWDQQSVYLLGYNPVSKYPSIKNNEFVHPLFISGKLIYLSHLNRLVCMAAHDEKDKVDAWIELLSLGYKENSLKNDNNFLIKQEKKGYPVTISVDIPEKYIGKEYFNLFTDLLCQKNPIMVLGLYIDNPLEYTQMKNEGRVNKYTRVLTNQLKIVTSHKKDLVDYNNCAHHEMNDNYLSYLNQLKHNSYNDKILLEHLDLHHPFFPMFITNPPPWLILTSGIKLLILFYHEPNPSNDLTIFQKVFCKAKRKSKKEYFGTGINQKNRVLLNQRQNNFFMTLNLFKEKIQAKYTQAFKNLEKCAPRNPTIKIVNSLKSSFKDMKQHFN